MQREVTVPVLVVGGGPVGLAAALDLGKRGIECLVLDKGDGSVLHPRAAMIATRTMEFLRRWGIADAVNHGPFPQDFALNMVYCLSLTGHLVARQDYPSLGALAPPPQSPEKRQRCPQMWFDPILASAVESTPGLTLRRRMLVDPERLEQRADGVRAYARDLDCGDDWVIDTQYVFACDGPGSRIRKALGIRLEGNPALSYSVNVLLRAPDLRRYHDKGDAERYLFIDDDGATWANMTVVDGRGLWRFTIVGSEDKLDVETLDVDGLIRRAFGSASIPFEIVAIDPWRRSQLVADRYHVGRIVLAGDSAHTMSPTGGFGMNTGIGDAVGATWMIEALLRGWGGPHLLDAYDAERRPVAIRNSSASTRNYRVWVAPEKFGPVGADTPAGTQARSQLGRHLIDALRVEWESLGIQLGYRYDDSPIVVPDGSPPTPDDASEYVPTTRPGSRAPHVWLDDGRSTLDLFGSDFVLVRTGRTLADASAFVAEAERQRIPLRVVDLPGPHFAAAFERPLVLVRPDGHTCWRGDTSPQDVRAVLETVRGVRRRYSTASAQGGAGAALET